MSDDSNILKEYLDPKFPLLDSFRELAPGTYKHCVNVSNMCETIALSLNLDVDEIVVAARYHDIGKMNFPEAFSENQNGSGNIHDTIEPEISYQIITRHVGDGIVKLLNIGIPEKILRIISQHHGNSILFPFYNKAIKSKPDISEDFFRYKCESPQSIEAAILMICDCIEAKARSKFSSGELETVEQRKNIVNNTVRDLMDDDQLDDLKVGDLKNIRRIVWKELENIYHKRVSYDISENKDVKTDKTDKIELPGD